MKSFKEFLNEAVPTNHANTAGNSGGFGGDSTASGPVAGYDPFLFSRDDDLLDQGFQAPGETGQDKWNRFFGVVPVMKMSLDDSDGDGPSIDDMVAASKEFVNREADKTMARIKRTFRQFQGLREEHKQCPQGKYFCHKEKKCMPIPKGYYVGARGWLTPDEEGKKKNGNGNGSNNGNGNGNGHSGNGNGGNGNGGGGNGGGE
tara:strand:- start:343 stop:951 length:609 start_codon:yes stop_codon:yes gene_type:complete